MIRSHKREAKVEDAIIDRVAGIECAGEESKPAFLQLAGYLKRQYRDAMTLHNADTSFPHITFSKQIFFFASDLERCAIGITSDKSPPQYNDNRRFLSLSVFSPRYLP